MQRPYKLVALASVAATAGLAPALATAASHPTVTTATTTPSPGQIRAALKRAESSNLLWATINHCDATSNEVGIRGEMPTLSFDSRLVMAVTPEQWSATEHRYVPLGHTYRLGNRIFPPSASIQEGVTLRFSGGVTLIARIDFEWYLGKRLLGSATRTTTPAHNNDAGSPKGYSVGTCSTA